VTEEAISRRAYEISERDDAGTSEENGQRAQRELREEQANRQIPRDGVGSPVGRPAALGLGTALRFSVLLVWVHDQYVAVGAAGDALADAAAEKPLEETRLVRPDDDQVDVMLIGNRDDLCRRLAGDADELDLHVEPAKNASTRSQCWRKSVSSSVLSTGCPATWAGE
jgi:hypothetical protein